MQEVEVDLHGKPGCELKIRLSRNQLRVLQDALSYSAWQFEEGGAFPKSEIKLLERLHDEIKEQTCVKGRY